MYAAVSTGYHQPRTAQSHKEGAGIGAVRTSTEQGAAYPVGAPDSRHHPVGHGGEGRPGLPQEYGQEAGG